MSISKYLVINAPPVLYSKTTPTFSGLSLLLPEGLLKAPQNQQKAVPREESIAISLTLSLPNGEGNETSALSTANQNTACSMSTGELPHFVPLGYNAFP